MPVRRYRFLVAASSAVQAMLAFAFAFVLAPRAGFAQQVELSNIRSLDFGRFVAGSGGTVVVLSEGRRSSTDGVILLNSADAGPAAFMARRSSLGPGAGSPGATFDAVILSLPDIAQLASGTDSMTVTSFVTPDALLTIPAGGTTLAVGATLVVKPGQAPGAYSGSFSVIVNYQ